MAARRGFTLPGEPVHSHLPPRDSQRAISFGRIEPSQDFAITLQLQSTPEDGVLARLACVAVDRLTLSGPVDFDREMNRIGCSPDEFDGELSGELISHLRRERPSQDRKLILFAHGTSGVGCPHVVGMSGDPPIVEHEQQVCSLLFGSETDL